MPRPCRQRDRASQNFRRVPKVLPSRADTQCKSRIYVFVVIKNKMKLKANRSMCFVRATRGSMQGTVLAAIGACLLSCATRLHAGQLEVVSVTATGFGTSTASATVDAVRNGVASVNGE